MYVKSNFVCCNFKHVFFAENLVDGRMESVYSVSLKDFLSQSISVGRSIFDSFDLELET